MHMHVYKVELPEESTKKILLSFPPYFYNMRWLSQSWHKIVKCEMPLQCVFSELIMIT